MNEYNKILTKIESWCDKLPYTHLKIEVQMPQQSIVLEKEQCKQIGFTAEWH